MTSLSERIDATTVSDLQARGSQKWADSFGAMGAWIAEMDFGLAPEIAAAMDDVAARAFYGYPPTSLWRELREVTAAFVGDTTGWRIDARQVAGVSDVIHALSLVISHYTAAGSAIVLPTPAYMPFLDLPGALGRELRQVPLARDDDGWHLDLDRLDRALDGAGALVWVNPHNPLGKTYTREETEAVVEIVARHPGVRVFSDEIHAPVLYPGGRHVPYASVNDEAASQAITAVSASKMWNLAGLKCAQLIFSNPADAATWSRGVARVSSHPSTPGMVASIAAYRDGGAWRAEILDYLDGNRRLLAEITAASLPEVGFRVPDATYLAFLDLRALSLEPDPRRFLLTAAGLNVTDGALCGEAGRGFVRLNFATPRPVLRQMLERTAEALDATRTSA
ncbi:MalY/PatB family protein [Propionicicella superfundia]|uniref:MalY/PatB family protein n=1 Tax=Propionicicella superfundia TaxID=348582 RepID=UPI00040F3597|nr:aminotransferase class I/II-fold pyridoxal phosphate-dependent enzyme [Propionicicella superfundia]